MARKTMLVWLAVAALLLAHAGAAMAWEIEVRHRAGYLARATEGQMTRVQTSSHSATHSWIAHGADSGKLSLFLGAVLQISDSKNEVDIWGYLYDAGGEPHPIGKVTIKKSDANRCVVFYGAAWDPVIERC